MRKFTIVDSATGDVKQTYQWGDDRDFPSTIPIDAGCEVHETDRKEVDHTYTRDSSGNFSPKVISDTAKQIAQLKKQLADYEIIISDFQEVTWQALGIVENKLPPDWQSKLAFKRNLRKQITDLGGTV